MPFEQSKAATRRLRSGLWESIFTGRVVDIGCGPDPLRRSDWPAITELVTFDTEQGDANLIDQHLEPLTFNCVHSSHLLEHLHDPFDAITRQLFLLRPGGFLVAMVPDFDNYEKGNWPSRFNSDHKSTWSLWRRQAPVPAPHVFVPGLAHRFNRCHITAGLVMTGYDWMKPDEDQTLGRAECGIEIVIRKHP